MSLALAITSSVTFRVTVSGGHPVTILWSTMRSVTF
jgi:hypothetical protein